MFLWYTEKEMQAITGDTPGIDPVWVYKTAWPGSLVYKMPWPGSLVYKMPWPVTRILTNQGSWSGHFINPNSVNSRGIPGDSLVFPCIAHVPSSIPRPFGDSIQFHWCFGAFYLFSVFSCLFWFILGCKMAWPGSLVYKMPWPVTRILTNQGSWSGHFINPSCINSWLCVSMDDNSRISRLA